jgi:hypothetical protein
MKILNSCEVNTAMSLVKAAEKYDAHVSFKMSLKDALNNQLSVSENRLPKDEYNFVRFAHLDFVVGRDFEIDFALEYDGPFHTWKRVIQSDCKKNTICRKLNLPLFRICASKLKRGQEAPVVSQLVEMFYAKDHVCTIARRRIFYSDKFHEFARCYLWAVTGETVSTRLKGRLHLETKEDKHGYIESRIWISAGELLVQLGHGRCHVPKDSEVCGKRLADYLAFLHATNTLEPYAGPDSEVVRSCALLVHGGIKANATQGLSRR